MRATLTAVCLSPESAGSSVSGRSPGQSLKKMKLNNDINFAVPVLKVKIFRKGIEDAERFPWRMHVCTATRRLKLFLKHR